VEKLLHTPTVQAKKLSAAGQSVSYPDALAALFNLPTGMTQQVSAVKGANAGSGQRKKQKPQENRVSTARAVYRSTYQHLTQASTPGGKDDAQSSPFARRHAWLHAGYYAGRPCPPGHDRRRLRR